MTSNSIGPRFIFINKKLYPLTGQCSQSILFPYQIGTNYFIRTGSGCCECGIIANQIFEVTSNGLKTELNDKVDQIDIQFDK